MYQNCGQHYPHQPASRLGSVRLHSGRPGGQSGAGVIGPGGSYGQSARLPITGLMMHEARDLERPPAGHLAATSMESWCSGPTQLAGRF